MRVVAITQRVDFYPERGETRDALDERLTAFLLMAGLLPVPVPNNLITDVSVSLGTGNVLAKWIEVVRPSGIVLSGGNDIGQTLQRDLTENLLLGHASVCKLPVLGICRGLQMMAHWGGTTLRKVAGHVATRHRLIGELSGEVNSYHNYVLADCPLEFYELAQSEDGEIEAIRHRSLPWEGWMWHPEREKVFAHRDLNRLQALFAD